MTDISTLRQSMMQVSRIKTTQASLADLQYQFSSGYKTNLFGGLGADVIASKRARANFNEVQTYMNNIDVADRRIKLMSNAITEIDQQAKDLLNAIEIQTQHGEFEMEAIGDLASKVKEFVVNLLNEQDGDRYLFAGADSDTKPVTQTGLQGTYMQTQINDWVNGNISTDELIESYRDPNQLTDTINGYSAPLSSGESKNVFVRVENNTEVDYTIKANNKGLRDLMTAIGMVENLCKSLDEVTLEADDPAGLVTAPGATQDEQNENFYAVFNDLARLISSGTEALEQESYKLAQSQAQISKIRDNHELEQATLQQTIEDVEHADLDEVAVKITSLQIQLEASYRVTASLSQLSLAFLL